MTKVDLESHNHTNTEQDEFVGIRFEPKSKKVLAFFPLGYDLSSYNDNTSERKTEVFKLLSLIKHYNKGNAPINIHESRNTDSEFPFDAYITIIRSFMQYGYYIESDIRYKRSAHGKINWKKTIEQVKPLVSRGSPVYTDFMVKENLINKNNEISLVHEWCVYEAFSKLGWLFSDFTPKKPTLRMTDDNIKYYSTVIHSALQKTFQDKYKLLFRAMFAMLNNTAGSKDVAFSYGTNHFQHIWESIIDDKFGIDRYEKKRYFPRGEWVFNRSDFGKGNPILPDTIMKPDDDSGDVFVIDAKYYGFINNPQRVPSASDINKQVRYGEKAQEVNGQDNDNVYNAFLIPYQYHDESLANSYHLKQSGENYFDEPFIYIGYSHICDNEGKTVGNKKYNRVLGILVDTKWLLWSASRDDIKALAKFTRCSYGK